jgi:hypothetical protein
MDRGVPPLAQLGVTRLWASRSRPIIVGSPDVKALAQFPATFRYQPDILEVATRLHKAFLPALKRSTLHAGSKNA